MLGLFLGVCLDSGGETRKRRYWGGGVRRKGERETHLGSVCGCRVRGWAWSCLGPGVTRPTVTTGGEVPRGVRLLEQNSVRRGGADL